MKSRFRDVGGLFGLFIIQASLFVGSAAAVTLNMVNNGTIQSLGADGNTDYQSSSYNTSSIQSAIDIASAGDTILVYSGTYYERLIVQKPLIIRGVDDGGGMPVVNAGGSGSALTLLAGGVTLEGFVVTNGNIGINVLSSGNTFRNNIIQSNNGAVGYYGGHGYGIYLNGSNNGVFENNTVQDNNGINVYGSYLGTNGYGVYMAGSANNSFVRNTVQNNNGGMGGSQNYVRDLGGEGHGITMVGSPNNLFSNNLVRGNMGGSYRNGDRGGYGYGITLSGSDGNTFVNNTVEGNSGWGHYWYTTQGGDGHGIVLDASSGNSFSGNLVQGNNGGESQWGNPGTGGYVSNGYGIIFSGGSGNTFKDNFVLNNNGRDNPQFWGKGSGIGIAVGSSSGNAVFNNYFNNSIDFSISNSANRWNATRRAGVNIVGGPFVAGNFWATPDGTGPSQTCADANRDGICDAFYALDSSNVDYLQLTANFTTERVNFTIESDMGGTTSDLEGSIGSGISITYPVGEGWEYAQLNAGYMNGSVNITFLAPSFSNNSRLVIRSASPPIRPSAINLTYWSRAINVTPMFNFTNYTITISMANPAESVLKCASDCANSLSWVVIPGLWNGSDVTVELDETDPIVAMGGSAYLNVTLPAGFDAVLDNEDDYYDANGSGSALLLPIAPGRGYSSFSLASGSSPYGFHFSNATFGSAAYLDLSPLTPPIEPRNLGLESWLLSLNISFDFSVSSYDITLYGISNRVFKCAANCSDLASWSELAAEGVAGGIRVTLGPGDPLLMAGYSEPAIAVVSAPEADFLIVALIFAIAVFALVALPARL